MPDVQILVHPECTHEVVLKADLVGSTEFIIKTIEAAPAGSTWAIGTELNLVKRLAAAHPDKQIAFLDKTRLLLLDDEPDRPAALRVGDGVAGRRHGRQPDRGRPRDRAVGAGGARSGCSTCRASPTRTDRLSPGSSNHAVVPPPGVPGEPDPAAVGVETVGTVDRPMPEPSASVSSSCEPAARRPARVDSGMPAAVVGDLDPPAASTARRVDIRIAGGSPGRANLAALATRFCSTARSWTGSPVTTGSSPTSTAHRPGRRRGRRTPHPSRSPRSTSSRSSWPPIRA